MAWNGVQPIKALIENIESLGQIARDRYGTSVDIQLYEEQKYHIFYKKGTKIESRDQYYFIKAGRNNSLVSYTIIKRNSK